MQESHGEPSQRLLSAQQVQMILHVDRSTVYRMAEDGRLPAIKVGRQWRFPEARIVALLREPVTPPAGPGPDVVDVTGALTPSVTPAAARGADLTSDVAAPVAQVAADLLGVMMVVTDMDGHPLTEVANPCPWFVLRSDDPQLLSACTAEWQQMADDPDFEPRFSVGALGFECARAFIRRGTSLVGMVLVGGIAPQGCDDPTLYQLDADHRRVVLTALPKVAAALSHVAPREPRANGTRSAP